MICQHGRDEYAIASFSDKIVANVWMRRQSVSPEPADGDWCLWSAPETTWDGHLIPSRASSWQTSRSVPTGRITSYLLVLFHHNALCAASGAVVVAVFVPCRPPTDTVSQTTTFQHHDQLIWQWTSGNADITHTGWWFIMKKVYLTWLIYTIN